jgi:Phosphatidylinositol N-acetylglucosaminyltransferase subunit Y
MEDGQVNQTSGSVSQKPSGKENEPNRSTEEPNHRHKRSTSNGLLSKLSFLRATASEADNSENSMSVNGDDVGSDAISLEDPLESPTGRGAMAGIVQQQKRRRRKGSLRKTAILGGKMRLEGKERRSGELARSQRTSVLSSPEGEDFPAEVENFKGSENRAVQAGVGLGLDYPRLPPSTTLKPPAKSKLATAPLPDLSFRSSVMQAHQTRTKTSDLGSPSTTDEEDVLTFPRSSTNKNSNAVTKPSGSYFPIQSADSSNTLWRSASGKSTSKSPSTAHPLPTVAITTPLEDEIDYTNTAWWGYVIIIATWLVFTVGMGSCLGVWSWAWDVGETPYAPPELEDDPTLPITGYYPALIILTAVMAWVWVVVAWVGMKYFRHAKLGGEDF